MAGEGDEVKAVWVLIVLEANGHGLKVLVFKSRGFFEDPGRTRHSYQGLWQPIIKKFVNVG